MKIVYENGWKVSRNYTVLHAPSGDKFDISHWTLDDVDEFMSEEHHRESHAEMLERIQ